MTATHMQYWEIMMNAAKRIAGIVVLMISFAAPSLFFACNSKSTQAVEEQNVLPNGSFEADGQPTLSGWTVINSQLTEIVAAPAPGCGDYSLRLTADWAPTSGFVVASVPGLRDGDIVRLSAYVKALHPGGGGSIAVHIGYPTIFASSLSRSAITQDTAWTFLSVTDTLNLEPDDSVWIKLSSLNTEIEQRVGLFDCVALERVED